MMVALSGDKPREEVVKQIKQLYATTSWRTLNRIKIAMNLDARPRLTIVSWEAGAPSQAQAGRHVYTPKSISSDLAPKYIYIN